MPIVSVSCWDIPHTDGQRIMRDVAPMLKKQGASSLSIGRVQTGNNTGQTLVVATYQDWGAYGQAMHAQNNDQSFQQRDQEAQKAGKLLSRTLIVTDEL